MALEHNNLSGTCAFVCPQIVFGADSRRRAANCLRRLGAGRVLVASDPGVAAAGWTEETMRAIEAAGLHPCLFDGITPNPRDHEVRGGAELYRTLGCDAILAIGGGSVIDCAKGIGIVVSNGGDILDYQGVDKIAAPLPPVVCIPTTGGGSADLSRFTMIRDEAARAMATIVSHAILPDVSLVDPVTLTTTKPALAGCAGMNALVHAIEAFVSNAGSPMTDIHALQAIVLLRSHLLDSLQRPDDLEARAGVMLGSLEAGLAYSNAGLGAIHAMSQSIRGFLDLPHGRCGAMLLQQVIAYNYDSVPERYRVLAESLGLDLRGMASADVRNALIAEIGRLRIGTGTRATLGGSGLVGADIPELARRAMADPCMVTNPRRPVQGDLEMIFQEAM